MGKPGVIVKKKGYHTDKQEYEKHTRSIRLSVGHDLAGVKGRKSKDNPHLTGGIGMLRTGDLCSNRPTGYRNGNRPMVGRGQRDGGGPSGTIWHMGEQSHRVAHDECPAHHRSSSCDGCKRWHQDRGRPQRWHPAKGHRAVDTHGWPVRVLVPAGTLMSQHPIPI